MIFTSGSTGTLEGAVIEHASLAIAWKTLRLQLNRGPTLRVLQLVSHSWGAPVIGVMAALMSGGCLCIPSEHEQMGNLASAANRMLTQTVARSELAYLESLILGGEPVTRSNIEVWHDKVCLLSAYGPAERTQTASVTKPLDLNCNARKTGVPNASVGLVVRQDDPQQLVPHGAVGELLIEGAIVGQGYCMTLNIPPKPSLSLPRPAVGAWGSLTSHSASLSGSLTIIDLIQSEEKREMVSFLAASIYYPGDGRDSPPYSYTLQLPSDAFAFYTLPLAYLPKAATGKVDQRLLRNYVLDMSQEELDAYSCPDVSPAASTAFPDFTRSTSFPTGNGFGASHEPNRKAVQGRSQANPTASTLLLTFETIGYDVLVKQCTPWPADTDPGTDINYINIPDAFAGSGLPGVESDNETFVSSLPYYQPSVICSPLFEEILKIFYILV
ncbi:hypothetical protein ASPBRDRAFT_200601 [Aspergillus brasiliensis CBS 101740]|uniref:AMP-dependent synthetase/ligase domain-containing protein n=1 Tax=Aspergillus brasiliensis (strain CBS 101740 / IMI 381727 / IBT 21946) TaxID=767769 RepID=A0A1L9U5N6_ASPBC|nr:hypothetical protein ASPBRDRAFT_200601 [Aspergillus brasiliensis CBS 101740]